MNAGLKLWEISDALQEIGERIAEAGGEVTPELEAELDAMSGAFEEKVERIALFVRECEVNGAAAGVEQERLGGIRRSYESKAHGLKNYLQAYLQRTGRTSLKTHRARVWTQQNGRPSIRYVGEWGALPEQFVRRPEPSVDTQAAYEAWKAGEQLPAGFVVEVGSHIRIS